MICYPNAKINIGLKVLSQRKDGFHNLSSFLKCALEIAKGERGPSSGTGVGPWISPSLFKLL